MSFSPLSQSHRDDIAALTAVLVQPAECGALSDEELPLSTRYPAKNVASPMRCARSLPGSACPPLRPGTGQARRCQSRDATRRDSRLQI